MSKILKMEYDAGWFDDDGLAWYVRNHAITADDFKYITGSDYVNENATK